MARSNKLKEGNTSAFQPKEDLEEYLTNDFNLRIYQGLIDVQELKELFEPLEFFNLFYEQVHFVEQNKTKPVTIQTHLSMLRLNENHHYLLIKAILNYYLDSADEQIKVCCGLINKIKIDSSLKSEIDHVLSIPGQLKPQFQLSSKKGTRINLIRVLNALYEIKLITRTDGQIPSKQEFMQAFGEFLGEDLSNYHSNLSQALKEQPIEVNLKVFDKMIETTKKAHYTGK